jgi:hypothetical protein
LAGITEVALKGHVANKRNSWKLLTNFAVDADLKEESKKIGCIYSY